jgi:hypothetical protein
MIARTEIISSTVMTMTVAALCHRRSGIIIVCILVGRRAWRHDTVVQRQAEISQSVRW